jgi:FixJ family two-component response regulator
VRIHEALIRQDERQAVIFLAGHGDIAMGG